MTRKLNEVKRRYREPDVLVDERQMLADMHFLLELVENMQATLARQAQVRQAELVLREFEEGGSREAGLPC